MEVAEHLSQLEQQAARLGEAARAGVAAEVPPCPGWRVRDVVTHVGGVHRWAASIVRDRLDHDPAPREEDLASPGAEDLLTWFTAGYTELVGVLRAADPDVQCYTVLPAPSPLAFWARRQAHETAIHRADVEAATGSITPFDPDFAADGIAELLTGFAPRRRSFSAVDRPRTVAIRPADAAGWLVTLAPDGIRAAPEAGPADCTLRGTASDLYLWLWNRPASVAVSGDQDLAELWQRVRVRWA